WLFKTFVTGFRRELNPSDLYYSLNEHSSHNLGERIAAEWRKESEKFRDLKKDGEPSLARVLARCFGKDLLFAGMVQAFLEFIIRLSRPFILLQLLHYSSDNNNSSTSSQMDKSEVYGWATALVLGVFLDCFVCHLCVQNLMHTGMKIRIACCSLLYRKILRAPVTFTEDQTSVGQVLNLLSNDVSRLDHAVYYAHYIWMAPLQAILVFYFLYKEVDLAASSGILLQLFFIPVLGLFGRLTNRLTSKYTVKTDERLRLTNEIIKGIKAIKMYAWEKPFSKLVDQIRRKEMHIVKQHSIITDISLASEFYIPRLCIFITVLSYVLLGYKVNAEKVYVVTALYDVLRMSMYTLFPMCLHDIAEALVSMKRLQKFMSIEEVNYLPSCPSNEFKTPDQCEPVILLENVTAQWSQKFNVLENINLSIKNGSLTGVVGQVGSGKTSLLHAILGELTLTKGNSSFHGTISYAPQEAWIFASSFRQNILFGRPMDAIRYERVIDICQLRQDLNQLPRGDATLLGDKGINLSGGQCARINLARAIYRDSEIYLLDDPLSSVDAVVGRAIFRECICGYLKHKTVILVTHQYQYLDELDRVVVLENGKIKDEGTVTELQARGVDLSQTAKTGNGFNQVQCNSEHQIKLSQKSKPSEGMNGIGFEMEEDNLEEMRSGGSVSTKTYLLYLQASKNLPLVIFVILASFSHQLAASGGDYFLAHWVNIEENSTMKNSTCDDQVNKCDDRDWYVDIYGSITAATILFCLLQSWSFFEMSMRIANNLHANIFASVIRSTIDFFCSNPLGRIMNRFSKDMSIVDTEVSRAMIDVIQNAIHIFAAFVVVISVNPWLIIPAFVVGCLFYLFSLFFIKTSRSIKRLEATTRSPVFNHVSDSLQGLAVIRALKANDMLVDEFDEHLDLHSSACFIFFSGSRGLGMYLDLFCSIFLSCVLLSLVALDSRSLVGDIGLAVTQCMLLINTLQWGVRQFAELENQMTSVERLLEYSQLPSEKYEITDEDKKVKVSKKWPSKGEIQFDKVSLRYGKQMPCVLQDICLKIGSKEKIGIVGRTGAGKSSLVNALFKMAYIDGEIIIDGVSTSSLDLYELRSKISILPQEPTLFTGTVRSNLDPLNEHSSAELCSALDHVGLNGCSLDRRVAEAGCNFSVGQRQLLCLARAILRRNTILVLDEATANVDPGTDKLIKAAVADKFRDCTVIIVAHRLHSIIHCDKIIVMEGGKVAEFDHPYVLLAKGNGNLYDIVQEAGDGVADQLKELAKEVRMKQ
ncbi:hypothetical protein QAD02_001094, partial [Eretmocerus hayati]